MLRPVVLWALFCPALLGAQEMHDHPAPEKLGTVSFSTSCKPEVEPEFNRAVALLHSFAYRAADQGFQDVARRDPECVMAHWGSAMTHFHQLWDVPPSVADTTAAQIELRKAALGKKASERERGFVHALGLIFDETRKSLYSERSSQYEVAMRDIASANPRDIEAQVFYALALISNASTSDKEHHRQKQALGILDPLFREFPDHPGIPHYLIHACDSQELAPRGLAAARLYAGIAPSAPHALHMPSHIFTRLGLWDDSIQSNLAAEHAAEHEGDAGEQLHAMDYLVYAYLQSGRDQQAAQVLQELNAMRNLHMGEFKTGYAATAMPIRYIVERQQWSDAAHVTNPSDPAQPQVVAIAVWARGLGFARGGTSQGTEAEIATLQQVEDQLHASGNLYWATQVDIMRREVAAWGAQAQHQPAQAVALLRSAADDEDGVEKLPLTPGPIVPAREQLGELLLQQHDGPGALREFSVAEKNAPGRKGALQGEAKARTLR